MIKPDDSSLELDDLRVVEERARRLLDNADAWDRFPIPIDDILDAAKVKIAPINAFDPASLMAYLKGKVEHVSTRVKSAIAKTRGLYDAGEGLIHIDSTVIEVKQTFLKLHETGHHDMPTHRKMYRFFQDCDKTLAPEIADQFEREANNFARYVLFKGNTYAEYASDCVFELRTPIDLSKKFGSSIYASIREFVRTNQRACIVYVLEPIDCEDGGVRAPVRRIVPSPAFMSQFGMPTDKVITLDHFLGSALPIGRKMTRPLEVFITDKNGMQHECIAEAFDTTYNIFILIYPIKALSAKTVVMPSGFKERI